MYILNTGITARSSITDWFQLAGVLNLPTNILSYSLLNIDKLQKRIKIGKRTVYNSASALKKVQQRLRLILCDLINDLPDNECIISYREGINVQNYVKKFAKSKFLLSFDLKGFYDHITLRHIETALVNVGFSKLGARMIGRYCVVKRSIKRGDSFVPIHTLQQGCAASPAISNIVGYYYVDKPILAWLRENYPTLKYKYIRYSDNVELFLSEKEPEGFRDRYKEAVADILKSGGFRAHDWGSVADNNPVRNMRFLGIVLNKTPRVEKAKLDYLRALFLSFARFGWNTSIARFYGLDDNGLVIGNSADEQLKAAKAMLKGHISYMKSINERHAIWLEKLYRATEIIGNSPAPHALIHYITRYKDDSQSVDEYVQVLKEQKELYKYNI